MKEISGGTAPARAVVAASALVAVAAVAPGPALAYVGPGAGLTAIGTLFALVAAVALAVVGFVWYPVKRLLKRTSSPARAPEAGRRPE